MEKDKQNALMEISMLDNKTRELEQQIMMIDQQLQELKLLQNDLEGFSKEDKKEVLMPLSRNIFVKGSLSDSDNVFVSVGSGVVIKKSLKEARELCENDEKKVSQLKEKLINEITIIVNRMITIEKNLKGN
jgi:prefoldin alpha subunit